jgi:hypothetical protein
MQIEVPNTSQGSNDVENIRFPARTFIDEQTNEVSVTDGYDHRAIVFETDTGNYKRHCHAYRHKPDDIDLGNYNPDAPPAQQLRSAVHRADVSADSLFCVCDRANDRIQVFKPDGTVVKEAHYTSSFLGGNSQ